MADKEFSSGGEWGVEGLVGLGRVLDFGCKLYLDLLAESVDNLSDIVDVVLSFLVVDVIWRYPTSIQEVLRYLF